MAKFRPGPESFGSLARKFVRKVDLENKDTFEMPGFAKPVVAGGSSTKLYF